MTTEKQSEANRENAKLGGVKTEEGKAVSRYNAIKHGLLSKEVLMRDEDESNLIEIGKRLRTELRPETELELILVDRITANVWRLRRVMQMEREVMEKSREGIFGKENLSKLGETLTHYDIAHNDIYGKIIRYETSIERGIYKALHELQRLQAARSGEKTPLPVAIDVDINTEN